MRPPPSGTLWHNFPMSKARTRQAHAPEPPIVESRLAALRKDAFVVPETGDDATSSRRDADAEAASVPFTFGGDLSLRGQEGIRVALAGTGNLCHMGAQTGEQEQVSA